MLLLRNSKQLQQQHVISIKACTYRTTQNVLKICIPDNFKSWYWDWVNWHNRLFSKISIWYPRVFFPPSNFHNPLLLEVDAASVLCGCSLLLLLMVASNWPVGECCDSPLLPEFKLENCASCLGFNGSCLQVSFPCKQAA